jgi:hypothetical protein
MPGTRSDRAAYEALPARDVRVGRDMVATCSPNVLQALSFNRD